LAKGNALYSLKRYEEALVDFEHALQLNRHNEDAHRFKMHTLLKLKRFKDAFAALQQAFYWHTHR
jgi:tetratricopeptide (TPR) repeat protein